MPDIFYNRASDLIYMVAYDGCCLLCIPALTGFEDGPMLYLGLVHTAQMDDIGMEVVLRAVSQHTS